MRDAMRNKWEAWEGKKDLLNWLKSYVFQRENSKVYEVQYVTDFVLSDSHKQMKTI